MNVCTCHNGNKDPDNQPGKYCSGKRCSNNFPIENIFFDNPKEGVYKV